MQQPMKVSYRIKNFSICDSVIQVHDSQNFALLAEYFKQLMVLHVQYLE
jgi:hypothetical protein